MSPFLTTTTPDPHRLRARRIRAEHPEVRALFGRNPRTALLAAGILTLHLTLAVTLTGLDAPWYLTLAVAWLLGAFAVHALFVIVHEACHRLVFSSLTANRILALFANLPALIPFAIPLWHYHLVHHRVQGQDGRDPDLPTAWEARLFGHSRLGKLAWHLLFPLLQLARTPNDPRDHLSPRDPWLIANVVIQIAAVSAVALLLGTTALLYLGMSLYFMFALHPLSGRFLQEHFVVHKDQETNSYYGPLSPISLHFGHHTEHHDFPAIPWNRLPVLRRMATEHYDNRFSHTSWTRLWLRFLLAHPRELSLQHRMVRPSGDGHLEGGLVEDEDPQHAPLSQELLELEGA